VRCAMSPKRRRTAIPATGSRRPAAVHRSPRSPSVCSSCAAHERRQRHPRGKHEGGLMPNRQGPDRPAAVDFDSSRSASRSGPPGPPGYVLPCTGSAGELDTGIRHGDGHRLGRHRVKAIVRHELQVPVPWRQPAPGDGRAGGGEQDPPPPTSGATSAPPPPAPRPRPSALAPPPARRTANGSIRRLLRHRREDVRRSAPGKGGEGNRDRRAGCLLHGRALGWRPEAAALSVPAGEAMPIEWNDLSDRPHCALDVSVDREGQLE